MASSFRSHTETTPLLGRRITTNHALPPITPDFIERIRNSDFDVLPMSNLCPHPLNTPLSTAYTLNVFLELRRIEIMDCTIPADYDHWRRSDLAKDNIEKIEVRILQLWEDFLGRYRGIDEIQQVLLAEFPTTTGRGPKHLSVIRFLARPDAPTDLAAHPLVLSVISQAWEHGAERPEDADPPSVAERYDITCTPRISYLVDTASQFAFIFLLAHYIIYPPLVTINILQPEAVREVLLLLLSASWLVRSWTLATVPYLITGVAFLLRVPYTLQPSDATFILLLWALALQFFIFHLPTPRSPLHFNPPHTLPLSVLLHEVLSRIVLPVLGFFLPAFLATFFLLSASLSGTLSTLVNTVSVSLPNPWMPASPPSVRVTFFLMLISTLALMSSSICVLIVSKPWPATSNSNPANPRPYAILATWDRYSEYIGHAARVAFFRTYLTYSDPYYFPAPLNLLQVFFIVTTYTLSIFFCGSTCSYEDDVKVLLWRVIVGPITGVVALFAQIFRLFG
ncbi:hypothetical protein AX16_005571 [Volvariella volvacea WC 439]|nr:hypothetical protein AX16_005571 [Volvariella volvacea WC 439]